MAKYEIKVNKKECIGCGACTVQCDNFELEDGKAHPKKSEVTELGCNKDAADVCPVGAIKITEKK